MRVPAVLLAVSVAVSHAATLRADTVELVGGGRLEGEVLEEDASGVKIKTAGGVINLDRKRVLGVRYQPTNAEQYELIKPLFRNDAEDRYRLSLWCRRHKLPRERRVHLKEAVELDPNHAEARRTLGYVLTREGWVTMDEKMRTEGRVRYNGRWVLPEEKDLAVEQEQQQGDLRRWYQQLRTIVRGYLKHRKSDRQEEGKRRLLSIADPAAVVPMVNTLIKEKAAFRVLLMDALGNIDSALSRGYLVQFSIVDDGYEVRSAAVDVLTRFKGPEVVAMYRPVLNAKYGDAMRRAAEALGRLGDRSAVPLLVDLLVTKEKRIKVTQVTTAGASLGGTYRQVYDVVPVSRGGHVRMVAKARTIASGPGVAAPHQITERRKLVTVTVENAEVRAALRELTGQDFGFNKDEWRKWLARQQQVQNIEQPDRGVLP